MAKVEMLRDVHYKGDVLRGGKTVDVPDDRVAGMLKNGQAKLPDSPDPRREADRREKEIKK